MTRALAAVIVLALAGCTVEVTTPTVTPVAASGPLVSAPAAIGGLIGLVNQFRADNGLAAAQPDPAMQRAAERHLADMIANDFFGHRGTDGTNSGTRIAQSGAPACRAAENLAFGTVGAAGVFQMWAGSGAHRSNMLTPGPAIYGLAQGGGKTVLTIATRC
jgi:uncharacterized protein YkwD